MSVKKEKLRGSKKQIKTWDYNSGFGCDMNSPTQDTREEILSKNNLNDRNSCLANELGITNLTASQLFSLAKIRKGK